MGGAERSRIHSSTKTTTQGKIIHRASRANTSSPTRGEGITSHIVTRYLDAVIFPVLAAFERGQGEIDLELVGEVLPLTATAQGAESRARICDLHHFLQPLARRPGEELAGSRVRE